MDPLSLPDANDPRLIWIGYSQIASPDRFAVPDGDHVYVYVPLDLACRWLTAGRNDGRRLELVFHATEEDEARLSTHRERYLQRVAAALDLWDHASTKFGNLATASAGRQQQ